MLRFPVKKLRKQFRLLLLLVLLTCAAWLTYLHLSLVRQGRALRLRLSGGSGPDGEKLSEVTDAGKGVGGPQAVSPPKRGEDSSESHEEEQLAEGREPSTFCGLNLTRRAPAWQEEVSERGPGQGLGGGRAHRSLRGDRPVGFSRTQYRGKANLHVFEDWCGGAVGSLRKNLHFPLFPHTRTTVKKLAVSPKWKNYGLRIFGYIHPSRDGDVQFSVASDDNSEFWLSPDESPAGAQLVAYVGKTGSEWTAPGEFTKFSSQVSKPKRLSSSRRYYFELLHKQDDQGSDHVEVGWRVFLPGLKFEVIDSSHISLYADEAALKMDHVTHIPQSLASHVARPGPQPKELGADMLRPDARDTFFLTPRIEPSRLENVLAPCAYAPTYVVKDFPIARYQGLQFVYLSFVYPNDFTRLTHMETSNKCFYRESPLYLERFGFYKYMKMDDGEEEEEEEEEEEAGRRAFLFLDPDSFLEEEEEEEAESPEPTGARPSPSRTTPDHRGTPSSSPTARPRRETRLMRALSWAPTAPATPRNGAAAQATPLFLGRPLPARSSAQGAAPRALRKPQKVYVTRVRPGQRRPPRTKPPRPRPWLAHGPWQPPLPGIFLYPRPLQRVHLRALRQPPGRRAPTVSATPARARRTHNSLRRPSRASFTQQALDLTTGLTSPTSNGSSEGGEPVTSFLHVSEVAQARPQGEKLGAGEAGGGPEETATSQDSEEEEEEEAEAGAQPRGLWPEDAINWQRTFSVGAMDFELLRSDWNDLRCNVSGNLQLPEAEAVDVVAQYMERLNTLHEGRFSLLRIVNVEKRRDSARGSRYLLELELQERGGRGRLRLSEYVFLRLPRARPGPDGDAEGDGDSDGDGDGEAPGQTPSGAPSRSPEPLLCRPVRLAWRQDVMVHFVVPVKNQARWVSRFLGDMASLHALTGDAHFSVVLVDFDSDDMDVERALRAARLPRYQYLKRTGNFERASGLQAGVDAIEQHRISVRPAHPLPAQHPGRHPQTLRGGQARLRARGHAPQLRELPGRPPWLLGGERLRALWHLQVGLRPRRRHEHRGVPRPLGRRGLGAAGQGPAGRPGGRAAPAPELLPPLPLQAGHVGCQEQEGPPGLSAGPLREALLSEGRSEAPPASRAGHVGAPAPPRPPHCAS
ncbi:N-acetyl-beta-glucosaminyl-glycoprotein 4-beta-N-acetylgalactosaminyltransferase 1 isoform X2 [Monodelphis domestica]|uniref:N-acetyl-beta-glucosaminyl-glycoprotein 4-beta-N-acetylgalactosaminyltransferase 1 isoform X2 n=1 Tax=Monodelphis domestica TaxID=13616 RepID=UPI0024E263B2|nr:N-acetyl-beta-glucosaminyl-glycoprotein 4-beta-N-acetylgalactosaminyltransferase 1 isoform X2 [Monodelphis domestica]